MSENPKKSPAATVGGAVASVVAVLLGRLLGWAFGLQLVLPLVAGLVVAAQAGKRLPATARAYAPALGAEAAFLTWMVVGLAVTSLRFGFHLGPVGAVLIAATAGAFVWLMVRPGPAPAGLLAVRHLYGLAMLLGNLPGLLKVRDVGQLVDTGIGAVTGALALVLLGRAILEQKGAAPEPAP